MKRFYPVLCVIAFMVFVGKVLYARDIWRSSSTATSESTVVPLCRSKGIFHGICTDTGVTAASTTILSSTWSTTATKIVGPITTLVADQCKYYDTVFLSTGMGYLKPNTAAVTILYDCF